MKILINKIRGNRFLRDSFWALLGNVVLRGAALITSIILAHILQKTTFGEFNSLKNTLTTLAIFTTFGLGYTSTKFVADYINSKNIHPKLLINKVYKITIIFSCLVSSFLFIFANEISSYYYKTFEFSEEIRLLSFWIVLTAISTSQNGIIGGLGIFKKLSGINVVMGFITIIVLPLSAYFYGLIGACSALLVIQFINCIFNFFLIRKESNLLQPKSNNNNFDITYKEILVFSLPLTLIEAFFSVFLWLNYFLLQNYQSYDEIAIYAAAMQWYIVLLFIPTVLRNVILSYFSHNQYSSKLNVLRNAISITFISTLLPAVIIAFIAPYISKLYGSSFHGLTNVLRIVIFIPVFSSIINVLEQFLFSVSKNWLVFLICFFKDFFTFLIFLYCLVFLKIQEGAMYLTSAYLIMNIFAVLIYLIIYFKTDIFKQYLNPLQTS